MLVYGRIETIPRARKGISIKDLARGRRGSLRQSRQETIARARGTIEGTHRVLNATFMVTFLFVSREG